MIKVMLCGDKIFSFNCAGSFQVCEENSSRIEMFLARSGEVPVSVESGRITIDSIPFDGPVRIYSPKDGFTLNGRRYRGTITIHPSSGNPLAINELPLEMYLAGVIASEMPERWPAEALKAQAVASRSYAISCIEARTGKLWHVRSTQASQVYDGVGEESGKIWDILAQTQGQVLSQDGKSVLRAYFSSTCAGATFDSRDVFHDPQNIPGVICPFCAKSAKSVYLNWPELRISRKEAYEKLIANYPGLTELGGLKEIEITQTAENGNLIKILKVGLVGETGKTDMLYGEDFRLTLDPSGTKFRSTVCKVKVIEDEVVITDGHGFGHNVGMCQYGAKEMARENHNYRDILKHYYPGFRIEKVY
jgi:stage II sporulation protein D